MVKNRELVTLAVYLVGGDTREVDTEDVAVKASELAPGRFAWRKYPDQINIEIIRTSLSDAKKQKYGALLTGTGAKGWMLTEAGVRVAQENADKVAELSEPVERLREDEKRRRRNEQARVAASEAYQKFETGARYEITRREVEAVFRLNEYIVGDVREKKVQRVVNALGDDEEVGDAIRFFAQLALEEANG